MINTQQWPNILHMGLMNDCMSRLNLEWSDASPCPPLLQPYLSALAAARTDENGHKARVTRRPRRCGAELRPRAHRQRLSERTNQIFYVHVQS